MVNISIPKNISYCALLAILATAGSVSYAQESRTATVLEEVIVTAQRRAEAIQDVPISITTLSADALMDAGATQLTDIAELTPGLRFDSTSAFAQPSIRGVGNSVVSSGATSNVGIYVDGFYIPNPLGVDFQLMSLESVQVLKGPQGTLFGRNTTGGAILVSSTKPSTEARATVATSYGSYNEKRLGAYGTIGLTDKVAIDAEYSTESGDGYWDNIVTGNDDDAQFHNWTGRIAMAVDISDKASLLLRYIRHDVDDGRSVAANTGKKRGVYVAPSNVPEAFKTADPGKISSQLPLGFTSKTDAYQMTFDYDLGFANLTSYTQYRKDDSQIVIDNDGTGSRVAQLEMNITDKTFSQEILLTSVGDGALQWTAGVFYFDYEDSFIPFRVIIPPYGIADWTTIGGSATTTQSFAAYIDATYSLTDDLYLTLGARYSRDKVVDGLATNDAGMLESVDDYKDSRTTPRVVLRYELDDNSSIYGSFTQGYKAGFLDVANPPPAEEVDPEQIDAYEIGYKYAGESFALSLAAFYYDYQDLQVSLYPEGTAVTLNAASASIKGFEGHLNYSASDKLEFSIGAAWTDAEYDDFPDYFRYQEVPGAGFFAPIPFDASGKMMQRAPELTATLSARYVTDLAGGSLVISGNAYYSSKFYFDGSEDTEEGSYTTLGLRTAWTNPSNRYTVAVYGDNLTDEAYRVQANETFSGMSTIWAPPRTVGVSLKLDF